MPNAEIVERIDSSDEWIQQRSGIKTRRIAGDHETVQSMAVDSARRRSSAPASTAGRSTPS